MDRLDWKAAGDEVGPRPVDEGALGVESTREEVRSYILYLLGSIAGKDAVGLINDESTIESDIPLDSIQFVELQVSLEEKYDIQLDPIEIVELNTFAMIVDYVAGEVAKGRRPR